MSEENESNDVQQKRIYYKGVLDTLNMVSQILNTSMINFNQQLKEIKENIEKKQ